MLDIANNTLYRCSLHFSPPNRQSGQRWGAFLLYPKSSPQSQVERVVQGLIPKSTQQSQEGPRQPHGQQGSSGCFEGTQWEPGPLQILLGRNFSIPIFPFNVFFLKLKLTFLVQVTC